MALKEVKVYVYQIKLDLPSKYKLREIFSINKLDSITDNVVRLGEDLKPHLLVVDESNEDFLHGRFMRLRRSTPRRLNCETKLEQALTLGESENLEEISHFVWNEKDQIMFGEYNFFAIRIWSPKLTAYLNTLFRTRFKEEIYAEVPVKLHKDTLELLNKDENEITKVDFRVVQEDIRKISKLQRWDIFKVLRRTKKGVRHHLRMSISSYWNKGVIDKGEVINFAKQVAGASDSNIKGLKVTAGENVYDLLKGSYWSCTGTLYNGRRKHKTVRRFLRCRRKKISH